MKGYKPLIKQRTSLVRRDSNLGIRRYFNTYNIGQGGSASGATPSYYTFINSGTFAMSVNNYMQVAVSLPTSSLPTGGLVSALVSFRPSGPISINTDLYFELQDPGAVGTNLLIGPASGLVGNILTNSKFVYGNTTDITTGTTPYTGDWSPTTFDTGFNNFVGDNPNGNWILYVNNTSGLTPNVTFTLQLVFYV